MSLGFVIWLNSENSIQYDRFNWATLTYANQMKPLLRVFYIVLFILPYGSNADVAKHIWTEENPEYEAKVHLYFFWSKRCPHCMEALPEVWQMEEDFPWLVLHSYEVSEHKENVNLYVGMASLFGQEARSVPGFFFCGNFVNGYDTALTTGKALRRDLQACYQLARTNPEINHVYKIPDEQQDVIELPVFGELWISEYSLPLLTLLIASMDAFNPCAFFVLLFLLSMMVHAQSRTRMLLIGGVFVFFSGAIYFLFMSAWLNVFLFIGELRLVTLGAGLLAVIIALINIKDFFFFKQGVSLSISDSARPKLFDRMRHLLAIDRLSTVLLATIVLAIAANSYELLCTAGFPMVYTRIVTLRELPEIQYYLYLLMYNLIYVVPLLAIVILFTAKLGSRKLSEKEGRVLKLMSGMMMLLLGGLLAISPQSLNNVFVAASILLLALAISWIFVKFFDPAK